LTTPPRAKDPVTDVPPKRPKRPRVPRTAGDPVVNAASTSLPPGTEERIRELEARTHAADIRLRTAHSLALALEASHDFTEAAPILLRTIGESLDWDLGALWAVRPSGVELRCVQVWLRSAAIGAAFEAATRTTGLKRGVGVPGRVWESGLPIWISDISTDTNFPRAPAAKRDDLHGVLAFPLTVGTTVLGVAEFFSRAVRPVDEAVVDSARIFGHQIGQFIERRAGEARVRLILKHALDASILMSATGMVLEWNPKAEQMFGWTAADAIGRRLSTLIIPPSHRNAHANGLEHFLATGEGPILLSHVETTALRRDGTDFPVELTVTPLHVNGEWTFHGFVRDITTRKQLERAHRGRPAPDEVE
jgi:two-component system cell cycle sensor histidine kinase/response regulator CckA